MHNFAHVCVCARVFACAWVGMWVWVFVGVREMGHQYVATFLFKSFGSMCTDLEFQLSAQL